jgi:exosortase
MFAKLTQPHFYFLLFVLGSICVCWKPLETLIEFSLSHDYGSHVLLIAPTSAYLIYTKRRSIFARARIDFRAGVSLLVPGAILWWTAHIYLRAGVNYLSVAILALIVLWISAFILCYGTHAFRAARFPLLFLVLMIPVPDFLLGKIILFLQTGSAAVAYWLFRIVDVPVLQEGFVFSLPNLKIEVARECSGIRSSLALLITTLLVGEFVLCSFWRKSLLVFSAVPILIFKNGLRIATIALLSVYVDPRFIHGWLHTAGGVVFYALGLLSLFPILLLLKRGEAKSSSASRSLRARVDAVRTSEIGVPELDVNR